MNELKQLWREIALTVSYVTCFPLYKLDFEETSDSISGLSKYLPIAGLFVGGALLAVSFILYLLHATSLVLAAVLTVSWFAFTSGLHLDGLMDTADGIFSHQSVDRILEIMRDSRVGNFGVIIGVSLLLLKFAAMASLARNPLLLGTCLIVVPCWARWAEVFTIGKFEYLRPEGRGKIWHDTINYPHDLYWSACLPIFLTACAAALGEWGGIAVAGVCATTGVVTARWFARKLGGQTGDTYGAVVEISECAALLFASTIVSI